MVIALGGKIITGPLRGQKGILYAEVDAKQAVTAKRDLAISGHYSRPDIFYSVLICTHKAQSS